MPRSSGTASRCTRTGRGPGDVRIPGGTGGTGERGGARGQPPADATTSRPAARPPCQNTGSRDRPTGAAPGRGPGPSRWPERVETIGWAASR
ncbi:hypothetical protein E2R59_11125 [Kocuria rosea]|uniref:Uncharacterized protein n=1 Tax=Kocuria rosea TaxID=1275 RepID=A0A4V3B2X7_KOCRO|nr:hypothetical protein E2R59_11125 [Kocuria rosea]